MFDTIREFIKAREHWFSWGAFLTGFTWDNFTLNRIDQLLDMLVLIGLITIATIGITLMNAIEERREIENRFVAIAPFVPLLVQFSLGGLFSGLFVFYSRSGTILSAWPFWLLLIGLLLGNEFFRNRYRGVSFQLSIYYIALLSLCVLLVPVFLREMGALVFLLSTAISAFLMALVFFLLRRVAPNRVRRRQKLTASLLVGVLVLFNGLYFTNIIPPIPLSMKELGFYHTVVREGGEYRVSYEAGAWWEFWKQSDDVFHWRGSEPLYCFASVFAPTDLDTKIYHHWQFKNAKGDWEERGRIAYSIAGGRDGGYRGYTLKTALEIGRWRCRVETARGQVIGQKTILVVPADNPVELTSELR